MDDLDGWSAGLLHDMVDSSTVKGFITEKLISGKKAKDMAELSLILKSTASTAKSLRKKLEELIDPKLKKPTNNKILNEYLSGSKKINQFKEIMKAVEKVQGLKKKLSL